MSTKRWSANWWSRTKDNPQIVSKILVVLSRRITLVSSIPSTSGTGRSKLGGGVRFLPQWEASLHGCARNKTLMLKSLIQSDVTSQQKRPFRLYHHRHFQDWKKMTNVPYQNIETIITTMTEKETLNNVFDRNIKYWTQLTLFIDAFRHRTLNLLCFTRHLAAFLNSFIEKSADDGAYQQKLRPCQHRNTMIHGHRWPLPSLFPFSGKKKRKKHRWIRRNTLAPKTNYFKMGQKSEYWYSSASTDRGTSCLSSRHQSLLPDLTS